jgi:alpha-ketoglutarate-dependent taurine dioxygenase
MIQMRSRLAAACGAEYPIFAFSHCRDVVIEVSRSGGDTVFADMRQAWRRLPDEVRRFIGALGASHDVAKCAPQDRREQTAVGTAAGRAPRRQAASGDG